MPDRSHPDRVVARYEGFYERAREHARLQVREPLSEASRFKQRLALAIITAQPPTGTKQKALPVRGDGEAA